MGTKLWNDLSMAEKAEMMKVAILNGITTLPEIRDKYNEFAVGGPKDKGKSTLEIVKGKEAAFNDKIVKPIEIGYDKDRAFTLTNAGSLTGAHLSEEMTDYIIQEAEKAGVDLQTAFGIAAAESTLGNPTDDKSAWNLSSGIRQAFNNHYPGTSQHINTYGDVVNEQELFNFYYPLENQNPYSQQIAEASRQAKKGKNFEQALKDGMVYADRLAQRPVPTGSVAQQAFEYFKQNGENYAPGYKEQTGQSYVQHVKKKGKEALQSPEIQKAITNYVLKKIGRPKEYSFGTINVEPIEWWKRAEGGNLFSGKESHSSKMNKSGSKSLKQAFLDSLEQSIREDSRFDSLEWRKFFTDLADRESSYRADALNRIGAKGYFQLMPENRSKAWNSPTQQFHEMYKLTNSNLNYFNKNLTKADWERAKALGIDMYGLLAGAHLGGAKNAVKALRGTSNAKDMNGSSVLGYMTRFSQANSDVPMISREAAYPNYFFLQPFDEQSSYNIPAYEPPIVFDNSEVVKDEAYSKAQLEMEEKTQRAKAFDLLYQLTHPKFAEQGASDLVGLASMLTRNNRAYGGNLYPLGGYTRENNNPISFDAEGNLTDQITGEKGTMMLPEVSVMGHTPTMWEQLARQAESTWDRYKEPLENAVLSVGNTFGQALAGGAYKIGELLYGDNEKKYKDAHTPFGQGRGHERDNIINVRNGKIGERNRLEMIGFRNVDGNYRYPNPRYKEGERKEPDELKIFAGTEDPNQQFEFLRWCAENANVISNYYHVPTAGNAWTRHGIYGDSAIVVSPHKKTDWRYRLVPKAHNKARSMAKDQARYVKEHIDDPGVVLHSGDIVDMRYPGSSYADVAWNDGDIDRTNSHTGTIITTGPDKDHTYVAHYMNKKLNIEPIGDLLGVSWTNPYITGIRRPGTKKHAYKAYGGNLFDGTSQPTQQMNNPLKPNIFRRSDGSYFYQADPNAEEIDLTPFNTGLSDDPSQWTYTDAAGKLYTPAQPLVNNTGEITQGNEPSFYDKLVSTSNKYYQNPILGAPARWAESWNNNTNAFKGIYDSPLVYANPYSMAVKTADNLFFDPNGLQKTINLYRNSDGSYADKYAWQKSLLGDALEATMFAPAISEVYNTAKPTIEASKIFLQNKYPAIFDPYTSWDATLGYHGDNIFSRALGTAGRRYGYTPKAEVPEFHRRMNIMSSRNPSLDFNFTEDGNLVLNSGRTGAGHDNIVNFATSEAARSHANHKLLSGIDDFIINPKAIGKTDWKSIQPSDTFAEFSNGLSVNPKDVTFVSGNTELLERAKDYGIKTLSSPRLRQLYIENNIPSASIFGRIGKTGEQSGKIGDEIQRLTSMRGAPTMQDYSYFEGLTGLNSGVRPAEMWNGTKEQGLELFGNWGKPRKTPTFNHVAYAPASNIESIYRGAKTGERPWSDYYDALENMPSARQQLGLNSAMDTYLGETTVPENFLTIKPQVRTRIGDVEIDNPGLMYRQGDASMGADFLNTGIVSMKNGSYDNPMFAQGKLFYGAPSEVPSLLDPSLGATKGSKSGRVFLLRKPKDMTAKSDLLVSDVDMANANKDSHIISPYIRVQDEEGNIIVTKANEDIRRVPFAEGPATSENTTLYRWKPNYGYKKVDGPESTYVVGKEIVDDAGNLNVNVDDLLEQIKTEYPYTLNPEDLINKGINGSTDLSEHIQAVVQSAQTYPLPKGVSRKEFVTAALYHDLGKVFGDFGHGTNSAVIASELNLPITKNTIKAVSRHMNQQEYFETASQLEKALHAADVGRGMGYKALIEKYPYLKYDTP